MIGIRFTFTCAISAKVWNRSLCLPVTTSWAGGETADARYDCISYNFFSVSNRLIIEGRIGGPKITPAAQAGWNTFKTKKL